MSPEKLFRRRQDSDFVRLALEGWTELPRPGTEGWETLTRILGAAEPAGHTVCEVRTDGADLYLLLQLNAESSVRAGVEALRRLLGDPFWRPFLDPDRYTWCGEYHSVSVRPGDGLGAAPLEHPARTWKREQMERHLRRALANPWHDAPGPEALGLDFVRCVRRDAETEGIRFDLWYREEEAGSEEAWAAAHLNTRLRFPECPLLLESVGWDHRQGSRMLVFHVPERLLAGSTRVEVWWATDGRRLVTTLPIESGAADRG